MNSETGEWDSWDELVTWSTWHVMESITKGVRLQEAMFHVMQVTRLAKFKGDK